MNIWLVAALWVGLALVAAWGSIWTGISVALIEIAVGVLAGNLFHIAPNDWINFLAGFGSILLTFLAGAEIDPDVLRANLKESLTIGTVACLSPAIGAFSVAYWILHWPFQAAAICGIALSTTSVAVVYAVMIESGLNETEFGKVILSACFVNDLGTVIILGLLFANYNRWLAAFVVLTGIIMWSIPTVAGWYFRKVGNRVSEPEIKFILLILFILGGLAGIAGSEAVLPAYLIGLVLARQFLHNRVLMHRMRAIAFSVLTPFYFLRAGSLVAVKSLVTPMALTIVVGLLAVKMATKFIAVMPTTQAFKFGRRRGLYTTLLMSTGLTFGTISALYGFSHRYIDRQQYSWLVTVVILSAIVPTIIAERFFRPVEESPKKSKAAIPITPPKGAESEA
jgi:Kef-type K+ transport system membrane component KefB